MKWSMADMHSDISGQARASVWQRWGLNWQAIAVLLGLLYFTTIGGTRAGSYCFSPVAAKHVEALIALRIAGVDRAVW